jgi:hypothetical protein
MKISVPLRALGSLARAVVGANGRPVGDTVKKVATALGVKKDCGGCDKRQKALNRLKPRI